MLRIVLAAFISPYREDRDQVRNLMNDGEFIEVYVKCDLEVRGDTRELGLCRMRHRWLVEDVAGPTALTVGLAPEIALSKGREELE